VSGRSRVDVDIIVGVRRALKRGNTIMTAAELAEALGIQEHTMYNNVRSLHVAGLIKVMGKKRLTKGRGPWARLWGWAA